MEGNQITSETFLNIKDVLTIAASIVGALVAAIVYLYLTRDKDKDKSKEEVKDLFKMVIHEKEQNFKVLIETINENKSALSSLNLNINANTKATEKMADKFDSIFNGIKNATKP